MTMKKKAVKKTVKKAVKKVEPKFQPTKEQIGFAISAVSVASVDVPANAKLKGQCLVWLADEIMTLIED